MTKAMPETVLYIPASVLDGYHLLYAGLSATGRMFRDVALQHNLATHEPFRETIVISLAAIVTLLIWRLWKFTVRPWLHPDEPIELPCWLPCKLR